MSTDYSVHLDCWDENCYNMVMEKPRGIIPDFGGTVDKSEKSVFISAPAKINLFLKVTGKRPDGYHNIFSWFQALDLCDHLEIEKIRESKIEIITDADNIPTGPENLVYQAAQLVRSRAGYREGFRIKLWKNIPVGAGLGGGSSDAASLIKGCDRLLGLGWSRAVMSVAGLELGSDIPFFFSRGQAEVTGRGEIVKLIELPTDYQVVLVTPSFEIRAEEAYRKLRLDLTAQLMGVNFKGCRQARELFQIISKSANDLERTLRESYPILDKIEEKLRILGANIVRISGSGPTVFALFDNGTISDKMLKHTFKGEGWGLFLACPIVLPA